MVRNVTPEYRDRIQNLIDRERNYITVKIDDDTEGNIHIDRLDAINPGNGHGSRFLKELLSIGDQCNLHISLVVDDSYNPVRLYDFYAKMGFMRYECEELRMIHAPHITPEMIGHVHALFDINDISDEIDIIKFDNDFTNVTVVMNEDLDAHNNDIREILKAISENHGLTISYEQKSVNRILDAIRTGKMYGPNKIIDVFSPCKEQSQTHDIQMNF